MGNSKTFSRWIDVAAFFLLFVGIIGGVVIRSRLPSVPIPDPDTWGYLNPALSWLDGAGFQQTYGRDWFYPAILAAILKFGGDFSWIVRIQEILGLAAGVLMWATFRLWLAFFNVSTIFTRIVSLAIGSLPILIYLLSPNEALFEIAIRPEGVLAFFVFLYAFCVTAYFHARWRTHHDWHCVLFGAGSLALSYAILLLKPSWGFALGFAILPLAAGLLGRSPFSRRVLPFASGVVVVAVFWATPIGLGFRKDSFGPLFPAFVLVSYHAPQIVANAEKHHLIDDPASVDGTFYQSLKAVLAEAKQHPSGYHTLGFDPEYIVFGPDNYFWNLARQERWDTTALKRFCYLAYLRAWVGSPGKMLTKLRKQLLVFLYPKGGDFFEHSQSEHIEEELAADKQVLPGADSTAYLKSDAVYVSYLQQLNNVKPYGSQTSGFIWGQIISNRYAQFAPWIQLCFFVSAILIFARNSLSPFRLPFLAVAALVTAVYGNAFTIMLVHSLDVGRFRISYAPLFLLTLSMMVTYFAMLIADLVNAKRPERDSAGQKSELTD